MDFLIIIRFYKLHYSIFDIVLINYLYINYQYHFKIIIYIKFIGFLFGVYNKKALRT